MYRRYGEYMSNEDLSFTLEVYEGPLDLLLSLINRNKINIYDIPISVIFEQYMEYIYRMQEMDLEIAGEFIDMASRLMLIKTKMLLPRQVVDGKAEDPRERLVDELLEYNRAKENAKSLGARYASYSGRFIKEPDEIGEDRSFVSEHETDLLVKAFERILLRQKENELAKNEQSRKALNTILTKRTVPVSEKIFCVLRLLYRQGETVFEDIMRGCADRSELVATFVAILQLIRSGRISIINEYENGDVTLDVNRKVYSA